MTNHQYFSKNRNNFQLSKCRLIMWKKTLERMGKKTKQTTKYKRFSPSLKNIENIKSFKESVNIFFLFQKPIIVF